MMHRAPLCFLGLSLLAGCHWLLGHAQDPERDRGTSLGDLRAERARGDGPRDLGDPRPGDATPVADQRPRDQKLLGDQKPAPDLKPLGDQKPAPDLKPGGPPSCVSALALGAGLLDEVGQVALGGGNLYLAATLRGTVNLGGGPLVLATSGAGVVASYTSALGYRWAYPTGGIAARGLAVLQEVWTVGTAFDAAAAEQIQLGAWSTAGTFKSVQVLGGTASDEGLAIAPGAGELIVGGKLGAAFSAIPMRGVAPDALLVGVVPGSSAPAWGKGFGGSGQDAVLAVAAGAQNATYAAGRYAGPCYFDLPPLNAVAGTTESAFVAGLDSNRNAAWVFRWGDTPGSAGAAMALAVAGSLNDEIYVAGNFDGSVTLGGKTLTATGSDLLLIKLDGAGKVVWWLHGQGAGLDSASGLALDGAGRVYLVGTSGSASLKLTTSFGASQTLPSTSPPDPIVVALEASGSVRWAQLIQGTGAQRGKSIAVDATGSTIVIAGEHQNGFSPGGACAGLPHQGSGDLFLLTLK